MRLKVECATGPLEHRPLRFTAGGRLVEIDEIVDAWPGEPHTYFKVTDSRKNVYIVRHDEIHDEWDLVMFQRAHVRSNGHGGRWQSASGAVEPPIHS